MKKIILFFSFVFLFFLVCFLFYEIKNIPSKKYSNAYFHISPYESLKDKDSDGVNDSKDILENAKEYSKKNIKYKSKYYTTGYPSDSYGVCTDLVGYALLHAGYDLMELVYTDIKENKELYNIDIQDKKIDFRRVRNLDIYFKRHATSLTLDIKKIEAWQGGDIVVFKNHIGIISDNRNKNGIPFVIHHANPYQKYMEEDILQRKKDIVGHYRIS